MKYCLKTVAAFEKQIICAGTGLTDTSGCSIHQYKKIHAGPQT
jgi:hypothetical protein